MAEKKQVKSLVEKLVEVLAELGPIEKKGRNPHFGYNYVSEGQLMSELRHRLSSRNIFLFTSVEDCQPQYSGESKLGVFVMVKTKHTFYDAQTGETFPVGGAGVGWDSGDKGVYKAITGATKYALMKNFLVTDEQDPEAGEQLRGAAVEPGRTGHKRTKQYEEETGAGDKKVETDLLEMKAFLTEHSIPDGFLLRLLEEKKLIDGRTKTVAALKPGILRRCLDDKSKANLIKAWKAQQADDESGSATPPQSDAKRTREGDQSRAYAREPITNDIAPADLLDQEGIDNWRKVKINFGEKKGTALGKLPIKNLQWWINNWKPKPHKGTWNENDLLLDAALVLASLELAND